MSESAPGNKRCFVPHKHCTVASGDCFTEGKCLAQCTAVRKKDHESRIKQLERDMVELRRMITARGNR